MENEKVILVTEQDDMVGVIDKMEAHRQGLLHRAFSVFIFNKKGEMLLQQRALGKYHSPGLWSNACCSHPRPGEKTKEAALRRLNEELGFQTEIEKVFDFVYKASFDNGLSEYEFDHVFVGEFDGKIVIEPGEVNDYRYKEIEEIKKALLSGPQNYTAWFHIAFPMIEKWWISRYHNISTS